MDIKMLMTLHGSITAMPVMIRTEICNECGWSIPTYYRKVKGSAEGQSSISRAEAEKIYSIVKKIFTEQLIQMEIYEKK